MSELLGPSIPFNRPYAGGSQLAYLQAALASGHTCGDGPFTHRSERLLERQLGAKRVYLTTSCTDALEISALLLELSPDDEVILPSFTFVSTANAYALRRCKVVFADIRPDTLNLDEAQLEQLITPRTRAIVPVHYAGVGCEMDAIGELARRHGAAVIEDNAHGLFGTYKGKQLGTLGALATQSFHETKNISCGEGGALVVNDERYLERAEILREKGTNRSRFFRGQVDKYTWVDVGSSFLPSDVLAAMLCAQLEAAEEIQAQRRRVWESYDAELAGWASRWGVRRPYVPAHCEQPYHMYYLLMPSLAARQALIAHLKERGIRAVFHYVPLHSSEMGRRYHDAGRALPVTDAISEQLVRLPLYCGMSVEDCARVVEAVSEFRTF